MTSSSGACAQQRAARVVLEHQPDVVAARQAVEERVGLALAPGRRRADVVGDRGRHVHAAVPRELRAEAPVDVLQVREERLVEQPHLRERRAAVERRPRARAEDALRPRRTGRGRAPPARAGARRPTSAACRRSRRSPRGRRSAASSTPPRPRRGRASRPATSSRRQSGSSSTSLLISATNSPRARSMPAVDARREADVLAPAPPPRRPASASAGARPCRRPSRCRPRSTSSGASVWRSSDSSATSSSARPFQVGMTTETARARIVDPPEAAVRFRRCVRL